MPISGRAFMNSEHLTVVAEQLAKGQTSATSELESISASLLASANGDHRLFSSLSLEDALVAAKAMDGLREVSMHPSRWAGLTIGIKDNFDVRGQVSRAGSRVLDHRPPAEADAVSVARLRHAGFIPIGRNTMSEFAFSGLGTNPHFGSPLSTWRREERRVAGGSTSGGAVAVAEGLIHAALGSDTGGSCRIPAAFNGVVGWKPTARRISREGLFPLSPSLDSVGVIGNSVSDCIILDEILSRETPTSCDYEPTDITLGLIEPVMLDTLESDVATAFDEAIAILGRAGFRLKRISVRALAMIEEINAHGGFGSGESYAAHHRDLEDRPELYDPNIRMRMLLGREQTIAMRHERLRMRNDLIADFAKATYYCDALIAPTVAILPPRLDELADHDIFAERNLLALRNTSVFNLIDGCALSIPIPSGNPVGLMVGGNHGRDDTIFAVGRAVEKALLRGSGCP